MPAPPETEPVEALLSDARTYPRAQPRRQRAQRWTISFVRSFSYAFAGIVQLIHLQRNAQVHLVVTIVICAASWAWGLSRIEWLILILTIVLVLAMEAINTAVEAVVDLASPEYHPLAKLAKDVAAGGVLLVALGAVAIALLLYGGRLLDLARRLAG